MVGKVRTCVFVSGKGSNLKALIQKSNLYTFPIKIELVISNNLKSGGLKIAKKYGINTKFIEFKSKNEFESKALSELKKKQIKLVCLAGFMKVLSTNFIKNFSYKIINIHPSLLPKFRGLDTHRRVLKSKEKYSGCTIHFVSPRLDSGKIILQKKILIKDNETVKSLKKKILILEHKAYAEAIISLF
jgi:phosphoribosylglycinamide formyltransferase-1